MYAVKVIARCNIDESILRQELTVLREIKEHVHNDCIVRVIDVYEDPLLVHVVMEYMGGGAMKPAVPTISLRVTRRPHRHLVSRLKWSASRLHPKSVSFIGACASLLS